MYERKDWKESEYEKVVRIKKEQLDFLKKNKNRKTIAGFLDYIITRYRNAELKGKTKK